jgi:hypothetical protein
MIRQVKERIRVIALRVISNQFNHYIAYNPTIFLRETHCSEEYGRCFAMFTFEQERCSSTGHEALTGVREFNFQTKSRIVLSLPMPLNHKTQ